MEPCVCIGQKYVAASALAPLGIEVGGLPRETSVSSRVNGPSRINAASRV